MKQSNYVWLNHLFVDSNWLFYVSDITKEIARIEQDTRNCLSELAEIEKAKNYSELKKDDLLEQINTEKNHNFEKEKEFNDLTKLHELEKEKEVVLQSDK